MNDDYDKLDSRKDGKVQFDEEYLEALSLIRSIYWPRPQKNGHVKYFVTAAEIDLIVERALKKYGINTIRLFFDFIDHNEMMGKRDSFTINSIDEDMEAFLGKPSKEKSKPIKNEKISDEEQSNRYMHLIYAPNQVNVDVLKEKPIEKITHLSKCMTAKYGHKAIEVLLDYCVWHRMIPKKGQWTHLTVESDIKTAIKWSVEKPDEYHKAIAKTNIQ
jgi:hypothetical protein